jgi:hypothetical protein
MKVFRTIWKNQYLGLSTLYAVVTPLEISKTKDKFITKSFKCSKNRVKIAFFKHLPGLNRCVFFINSNGVKIVKYWFFQILSLH